MGCPVDPHSPPRTIVLVPLTPPETDTYRLAAKIYQTHCRNIALIIATKDGSIAEKPMQFIAEHIKLYQRIVGLDTEETP
jgi:hypothetical protein